MRLKDTDVELVIPRERSMLDVLNAGGHEVMYDCQRGECGVCAIDVVDVEGEIDHRDVFFSDHQKREQPQDLRLRLPRARHDHGGYAAAGGCGLRSQRLHSSASKGRTGPDANYREHWASATLPSPRPIRATRVRKMLQGRPYAAKIARSFFVFSSACTPSADTGRPIR